MDYFENTEYGVDSFWFIRGLERFTGHGLLTWHHDKGFHLLAFLDKTTPATPSTLPFGERELVRGVPIRMEISDYAMATAPQVFIFDKLALYLQRRLTVDMDRVIFASHHRTLPEEETGGSETATTPEHWHGTALFRPHTKPILPDSVYTEVSVAGSPPARGYERAGIRHEDGQSGGFVGRLVSDDRLELQWWLPASSWSLREAWAWAEGAELALSILLGETVQLLQRELETGHRRLTEIRKANEGHSLGVLRPFPGQHQLHKQWFIRLTEYFGRNGPNTDVCRHIWRQLVDASRQETPTSRDLLVGSLFEAITRTIHGQPFNPATDPWNVSKNMERFRKEYLSDAWMEACEKALGARGRLRTRNAHQDWIRKPGGSMSTEAVYRNFDDLAFLSRFYRYMILAMAGEENLKPIF